MTIQAKKMAFGVVTMLAAALGGCSANVGAGEEVGNGTEAIEQAACATTPVNTAGGTSGTIDFSERAPNGAVCNGFFAASPNTHYGNAACGSAYLIDVALVNATQASNFPLFVTDVNAATAAECAAARFTVDVYADGSQEVVQQDNVAGVWNDGACTVTSTVPASYVSTVGYRLMLRVAKTLRVSVNAVSAKPFGKGFVLTPDLLEVRGGIPTCIF